MITSTNGQSPYQAMIGTQKTPPPIEMALATPPPSSSGTGAVLETEGDFNFFGDDGFTFGDVLDVINPLQHIPVVSTMYREASEDTISAGPRILGSTLFFGPIGLATAVVNVMIEEGTGKDIGSHIASMFSTDEGEHPETGIAQITSFETAAGGASSDPAPSDDVDPVSAWAAGELAWMKQQQQPIKRELAQAPANKQIPDASDFLRDSFGELAGLNTRAAADAARAASWAYRSTADLVLSSR